MDGNFEYFGIISSNHSTYNTDMTNIPFFSFEIKEENNDSLCANVSAQNIICNTVTSIF